MLILSGPMLANFCCVWIYRARARKWFSSLYRGENFLRSGAENPRLDLPRPSAETIFSRWTPKPPIFQFLPKMSNTQNLPY